MKIELTSIDKIKKVLGMEIEKSQIKLATETLNEGEATIEAEVFEAGQPVMIVNEDERIPLPVNEEGYLLDNGMLLIVVEEGIIAEIKEPETEEEAPAQEEEVAASDSKSETPLPKSVIESIVKETKFSKEEMDAKDTKIAELEAKTERNMISRNTSGQTIEQKIMSAMARRK